MKIKISPKAEKFLTKHEKSDKTNINLIKLFIEEELALAENPCALKNASKIESKKIKRQYVAMEIKKISHYRQCQKR